MDETYEHENGMGRLLMGLAPLVLIVAVVLFWRSKQKAKKDDRAFKAIVNAISDADIPERAKDILIDSVDEVRNALTTIRERATELADRG